MKVVPAPTAANHGLAVAPDIVGQARSRLVKHRAGGKAAERYVRIARMPQESTVVRRQATRFVFRIIEDGKSVTHPVGPRLEVTEAHPELDRQVPPGFPGV